MNDNAKGLLIASGIAAAAGTAALISHAVTDKLVRIALCREEPAADAMNQDLTGKEEMQVILSATTAAAAELEKTVTETVELEAPDGVRLVGHWYACPNPKRTVIAMHGWRSSWTRDFGLIANFLHTSGCNVLYAEQRGQGESGGDYMGFGLLERFDCAEWVKWVNNRVGTDLPVCLAGISMGATTVLMAAGLSLPENVTSIIADCGFTSADAIWKHVVEHKLHLLYGLRSAAADDLCRKHIQVGAKDYSATDALRVGTVPVLFIHGSDDHFVPLEMTFENYKACAAKKRLLVVPGADHGLSYWVDKDQYEAAVRSFWRETEETV